MDHYPLTVSDTLTITVILCILMAAAVYTYFNPLPTHVLTALEQRDHELCDAANDAWREYVSVVLLGYTNNDARSHLRAYVHHRYDFDDATKRMINRVAIVRARNHLMQHGAHVIANDIIAIDPNESTHA